MKQKASWRLYLLVGFGALAVAVASLVMIWHSRGGEASPLALDGVSLGELGRNGFHVTAPPDGYVARIGIDDAKRAANLVLPNLTAKQVLLADVKFDASGIAMDTRHVWIVNFDPSDQDLRSPHQVTPNVFFVAFVDADSGKFLDSIGEGEPVPPGTSHEGIIGVTPGAISTPDTPNAPGTPAPAQ